MAKKIVAITACAAGIAHTYMAAEALELGAKELNYSIKVETQGTIGIENELTLSEIEEADLVLIAADINIDLTRFSGKNLFKATSNEAIKDGKSLIETAFLQAKQFGKKGTKVGNITLGKTKENGFLNHLMSGISYMIPMCIAAGLIMAVANLYAFQKDDVGRIIAWGFNDDTTMGYFMHKMFEVGQIGFKLMIPLFAGFVANSIADRPAIAPAMVGAYIINDPTILETQSGGGFLGAIIVAFLVGHMVKVLKKVKYPKIIQPLVPIMIIPFISTFIIAIVVIFLIGTPIAGLMDSLYSGLSALNNNYASAPIIIGAVIGAMIGFDLGGPVNKTALVFGTAIFTDTVAKYGIQGANFVPGTAAQAAISVAPLGVWLAAILFKNKFSINEKISSNAAFGMGIVGITEGAIPFAASNPLRMITANVIGSAVAGSLVAAFGCKFYGGIGSPLGTVIGYIEQPIPIVTWVFSVGCGILTTALLIGLLKPKPYRI